MITPVIRRHAARTWRVASLSLFLLLAPLGALVARELAPPPPSQVYGALFHDVQTARVFPDSKTFVDVKPLANPAEILRRYEQQKREAGFSLQDFVRTNFEIPAMVTGNFATQSREELTTHIDRLWPVLTRQPSGAASAGSSLLPLTTRYVVPGGRFREVYYWDSYFTMLGLQAGKRHDLVADMVATFASLIDRYGHIPNGSRSYYLSRSQPPFFAAMVALQAEHNAQALVKRLPQLEAEYAFWMNGAESLAAGTAFRRVVRLDDGSVLNRYWDDLAIPRDEAYAEDLATARASGRPEAEVYRDLRAAAESGWDFSSRWLGDGRTLATIRTTEFLPVDLNSLLYQLENTIADGCRAARRADCTKQMLARAKARQAAMAKTMWDEDAGAYVDFDWKQKRRSSHLTAATAFPLFAALADKARAQRVAKTLREKLLQPHGLATTLADTGQQWDAPNGWAPLQWVAIDGLRRYGESSLAAMIAERWLRENARVYCLTGKLVEKYNVRDAGEGAGGEYPVQDGFGWTNGVVVKVLATYPELARQKAAFTGGDCGK